MQIDFFISHSKETKQTVAIPLAQIMITFGFNVWIDRKEIACGDHIYNEIRNAISKSTYCIAIIDSEFLSRTWTQEELNLFHKREVKENRTIIIPIYVGINKETVYETLSWLEGRAFDKLHKSQFNSYSNLEILCRIVGRYYKDKMRTTDLEKIYYDLLCHDFPCKETLSILLEDKEYLSSDLRISIIELCNIGGIINAIYKALTNTTCKKIDICFSFGTILRRACFDANYSLTYSMYISAFHAVTVALFELKCLLDSQQNIHN